MLRTMHTLDPALPSVTVIAVDYQDFLVIWNASHLDVTDRDGLNLQDDMLNEALQQAMSITPPPTGEVIDFAAWVAEMKADASASAQTPSRAVRAATDR